MRSTDRAFYVSLDALKNRESVERAVSEWVETGVNKIYLLAKRSDGVTYRSRIARSRVEGGFDAFAETVWRAKDAGIGVHAWFCCYIESVREPSEYLRAHLEALLVNRLGKTNLEEPTWSTVDTRYSTYWVCPSHTGYRQYLMSLMREVVENYQVDGIHLDYIRYPEAVEGRYYCYCRRCMEKFKEEYGYELPANDVIKNRYFVSILCENVTDSVREFSSLVHRMGRKTSAYVFTDYVTAIESCYQDWPYFSRFLDFLCPTTYEVSLDHVRTLVHRARSVMHEGCALTPVVLSSPEILRSREGGRRWSSDRTPEYVLSAARACLESGADGVVFFLYDSTPPEVLKSLRTQAF